MTSAEHAAALAEFGRKVMSAHRDELDDLDGATLQDLAIECGLLHFVEVAEPCGESCRCAGYYHREEWPVQCLREVEPEP